MDGNLESRVITPSSENVLGERADKAPSKRTRSRLKERRGQPSRSVRWLFGGIGIGSVAIIWQLISVAKDQPFLFPSIGRITAALSDVVVNDHEAFLTTLYRLFASVGLGLVIGWAIGILVGGTGKRFPLLMEPLLKALTAMPAVSWTLLAILWMRDIEYRIAFVVTLLVLPYYAVAVHEGIRRIDREMVQGVQQFRPTRWQTMRFLLIPNSLSDILSTNRFALGTSLKILVFIELITASTGVGALMSRAQRNFRVDELLALAVVMVILTFVLLWLTERLEARVLRWRPERALR